MKKILAILLSLALLLSAAACSAAPERSAAPAEEAEETQPAEQPAPEPEESAAEEPETGSGLPAVGDTVEGFVVRDVRPFPMADGTVVLFEHEKTGAQLMYIANGDTDRVYDLTFFTRAVDNTGLPHVFEHSTLSGSDKYPSKSLFFNLSYQTYNTFMNAMTYPLMTTYPVSSLSEAQLLKYADFYTDSCLHPSILKDESIYREEAWRYRLADMDDDLTIEGTVYSEMLGAMDLESTAYYNMFRTAFPGSTIGNVSGGDPAYIPDMTWDSLKSYHDLYYHPSNSVAYLYGQLEDYTAFLSLLNEAFSGYEKRSFTFEDADYEPLTAPVSERFAFPVEASSGTEHRTSVYYAVVCPGLKADLDEELILNTLTDLLTAEASPLMQRLKKVLPSASFSCYIETEGPEDAIVFAAENVDPEDAETFRATVDEVLADLADTGFQQDFVDGVMSSLALTTKLAGEEDNVGVNLILNIAYGYSSSGDPFSYLDYVDGLEKIDEWNREGLYTKAISDWLVDSESTALSATYPEPGLRETLDAAEAERLADVKAAMSEEELQAIIDQTNAVEEEEDASAYVAQLQAVSVSSLPEELREYTLTDETADDGVRVLTAVAGVDGVGSPLLLLDASGLPQEDIHWFALFTALVGELDSADHTSEELAVLTTRYLYDGAIRLSLMNEYGTDGYTPYLRLGWTATDEDLEAGYDLMYELLFESRFTDTDIIQGLVSQIKAQLNSSITSAPYNCMLYRTLGATIPLYAYYNYFNYLDFYAFLERVDQMLQEEPEAVTAKLEEVQSFFHNRTNAISAFAGSEESIAANRPLAEAFFARLDARPVDKAEYVFATPAESEALVVDSGVQFNGVVADFASLGLDGYSADQDALTALLLDMYLYPMLRDQYGAYSLFHGSMADGGMYLISYRDPNVLETFDVYAALPDYVAELELDQDTLDGYILSAYSYYAAPEGELSGAVSAIVSRLCGEPETLRLDYMRDLKDFTPKKVKDYAAAYEKMMENGRAFTAGGAAAIAAVGDLYDEILNPFGAVDSTQVELTDVPENAAYYEAVRFVFENGLMSAAEEDSFGVRDAATLGELCGALYGLIGGDPAAQEEAVAFLASYGIAPTGGTAEDPITGRGAEEILDLFSQAVEVDYSPDASASAGKLDRAGLAETLYAYYMSALA